MLIARQKKKENIVEYVIYMWHIEDLIRSYQFDLERIYTGVIQGFDTDDDTKQQMRDWYAGLITAMEDQNLEEKGHLEEINDIINELSYLHVTLLSLYQDKAYKELYHNANPHITALQEQSRGLIKNDLIACLNGVYGILLLRMQGREVSPATKESVDTFSKMLAYLAIKYKDMKDGKQLFPKSMNN